MLDPKCLSIPWITQQSQALGCRNPIMLEKAIVALQLLGHLAETNLPFQFKGGTSLLLRLPTIRRLSIDIDIITQAQPQDLVERLASISQLHPFLGYEHNPHRDAALPPKKHYEFFYQSVVEPKRDHILLDVLFETQPAAHTEMIPIRTSFINPLREVRAAVPTINSLLGDKLTAFAPTTIGIPYLDRAGHERKTDIIKQLFDVGVLFDAATDLTPASATYEQIHSKQCEYRQQNFTYAQTLDDSINAALQLTQTDMPHNLETAHGRLLFNGVLALQNHLVNLPFRRDEARIAAGKAALLAACIKHKPADLTLAALRYDPDHIHELRGKSIGPPWAHLTSIRNVNPQAFHYWWHAARILQPQ